MLHYENGGTNNNELIENLLKENGACKTGWGFYALFLKVINMLYTPASAATTPIKIQ